MFRSCITEQSFDLCRIEPIPQASIILISPQPIVARTKLVRLPNDLLIRDTHTGRIPALALWIIHHLFVKISAARHVPNVQHERRILIAAINLRLIWQLFQILHAVNDGVECINGTVKHTWTNVFETAILDRYLIVGRTDAGARLWDAGRFWWGVTVGFARGAGVDVIVEGAGAAVGV